MVALSRHQVLVAVPLSPAALRRLDTFFEVHSFAPEPGTSEEHWALALRNMAGALVDDSCQLGASLLGRLPALQAVASTAAAAQRHLDVAALTRASVRATHGPADASLSRVEAAWAEIEAAVHRGGPANDAAAPVPARWGRSLRLGRPAAACVLALQGRGALHDALLARARRAGMPCSDVSDGLPAEASRGMPDLLVRTGGDDAPAVAHRVLDVRRHGEGMNASTTGVGALPDRDSLIAEDLVASLGFGRNGWHPVHWLNPEVACISCC